MTKRDDPVASGAAEHFPGSNPNPVMRVGDDGTLTYANASSAPLLATIGVQRGEMLPALLQDRFAAGAASSTPFELQVGPRTFELLAVRLPESGFTNVYGTDVTAARLVDKFPDLNPNPVLRISEEGVVRYANGASGELLHALRTELGQALPQVIRREIFGYLDDASVPLPEVVDRHGTYVLKPVRIPELGLINVYGTDVTAARAVVKFPDQNPNPVFRLTWDGILVYANPASRQLVEGLGWAIGSPLPGSTLERLLASARAGERGTVEVVSDERRYRLLPVDVPEFGFINVYGTDVTAVHDLEEAYRENQRLLLNILPEPVADRLRRGERPIADRFDDVSLLFADIVGFTSLSGGMGAHELVSVLDDVFSVFDGLAEAAGLEKVKTIGDAYMVVGGLPEPSPDHLDRLARMGLALAGGVESIPAARRLGIQFRIGIHSGPVVAGVIGTHKFIYDVWGDTVNVASRMESTGTPGRIQVTEAVEARLRGRFHFESRGLTEVRGKGPIPTFFLVGEKRAALPVASDKVRP